MIRRFLIGLLVALALVILLGVIEFATPAGASGPKYIAGVSYFDPQTLGTPLVWANELVNYYTDQGNLSPVMPGPSTDALVADAISQWASIRATDQSYPPNPVMGAPVAFQTVIARTNSNEPIITIGELNITQPQPPVILSSSTQTIFSDANGLATTQINTGVEGATVVLGTASVGNASVGYQLQSLWPIGP